MWSKKNSGASSDGCRGDDLWISDNFQAIPSIENLPKLFFNPEFMGFIGNGKSVFSYLINAKVNYLVHWVAYHAGGSYKKHMDEYVNHHGQMVKNYFTFNLTLIKKPTGENDAAQTGGEIV